MFSTSRSDAPSRLIGLPGLRSPSAAAQAGPGAGLRREAGIRNELLAALPEDTLARLRPSLELVELKRRQALHERHVPMLHAYFIEQGAASMLCRSGDSGAVEVGTAGRSDLVGIPIVLGTGRSPHRCIVQVPGNALRIGADALRRALEELPCVRALLLAYVQAVMIQATQLVVCNTRHALKERLARWLLTAHDRLDGDEIPLTHDSLGRALGVRRAGVTKAAGELEAAGLVRRERGRLTILDRSGLERASCECYRAMRAEQRRICTPETVVPARCEVILASAPAA